MCGFAGEFVYRDARADLQLARRMASRLAHRGPDEAGSFLSADGRFAVGFRRLAVIDPAGSHQPMCDESRDVVLAFNGEIYNYPSLKHDLAAAGASFGTSGDTEVLLCLYLQRGLDMFDQLLGMFAFAIYDAAAGHLLLARDRLGQKPLWYASLPDRIVFASEAKALLEHPLLATEIDRRSLIAYLTMGYVPGPHSAWRGIRKLSPGTYMQVARRGPTTASYWSVPAAANGDPRRSIRQTVTSAIQLRTSADVPLGVLLSGGLDSAIITAVMSRASSPGEVHTFTAGFTDTVYDERPAAAAVASHCRTTHTELLVSPRAGDLLDDLVRMYDEPFADSGALATFLICRAARQHVTVALAGDGGDEAFGGYDRYRALWLTQRMAKPTFLAALAAAALVRPFARRSERHWSRRLLRFVEGLWRPPAMQYFFYRSLFSPDDLRRLLTNDFLDGLDAAAPEEWFCALYEAGEGDSEVRRAQRHDMLSYLPDDLLVKADIASMASSLELRAPMLDHRVVELGLSLPADMKVGRRRQKLALREAFADMLPAALLKRPKRGFGVPLSRWLRRDLRERLRETLLGHELRRLGVFRQDALAALVKDHVSGRADHGHRLWALLVLGRWLLDNRAEGG